MKHSRNRLSAEGYFIQLIKINGVIQEQLSDRSFVLEDICKGGFRFITDMKFELEDRVQVMLGFPDGASNKVLGRICYSDEIDDDFTAYGFSILDGFYSLQASAA